MRKFKIENLNIEISALTRSLGKKVKRRELIWQNNVVIN